MILINKADFLSEKQRQSWADYFDSINLPVAFFSALEENQNNRLRNMKIEETDEDEEDESDYEEESEGEDEEEEDDCEADEGDEEKETKNVEANASMSNNENIKKVEDPKISENEHNDETSKKESVLGIYIDGGQLRNSTRLLTRGELIELLKTIHKGQKVQEGRSVVGLVGYPNVGKSSTINSLLTYKKVSVSATPGKTKHFQVWFI